MSRAAHDTIHVAVSIPREFNATDPAISREIARAIHDKCVAGFWRQVSRPRLISASSDGSIKDSFGRLLHLDRNRTLVYEVEVEPDD